MEFMDEKINMNEYETIVGMEIHVELATKSKMFCGCKNDPFFAGHPNIYTCPVCLGLPGGLPVANRQAVESTIRLGLAVGSEIQLMSKFDRKNYFYPDLAKGYQISQYDQPFCRGGKITTEFGDVRIHRIHLEEDTGKLLHTNVDGKKVTLVDFNRSGVPLVEIVTEPDIRSGEQAKEFLKKLHQIIRYIEISEADMEQGSMRLEPNISVRIKRKTELPPYKVEVKNINSFNFVKRAIEYEAKRHIEILEKGKIPSQETRGWNETKGETFPQRLKENADDYRYFPEPDIPPIRFTKEYIQTLKASLPELPDAKRLRYSEAYQLNAYDSALLTETRAVADFFEEACRDAEKVAPDITAKHIANWIINKKTELENIEPAELIARIKKATQKQEVPQEELTAIIGKVVSENAKAIEDYKNGKEQSLMFLVGQMMKLSKGRINPADAKEMMRKYITSKGMYAR
jgi:aspartyl-tRNA(Asn)/glutamyl-tRNA(Gln) amidotransferase subunit B